MQFVADLTVEALRASRIEDLERYVAILRASCNAHPPPFGMAWYGDRFRRFASDPQWLATCLVANAEKEGQGSRKLWQLSGRASDSDIAEQVRLHAIDESRHSLLYIAMLNLTFPEAA